METTILTAIEEVASKASATSAERFLAAEAGDAIGFVNAMRQRYDAVLMNPPFGAPIAETKDYLRQAYPWIPSRTFELSAAFVGRGIELCREGGFLGAITKRDGLFLTTFERWREEVVLGNHLMTLADLGFGVMQDALVEAAAYAIECRPRAAVDHAVFVRLVKETRRAEALADSIAELRETGESRLVSKVNLADFDEIPGSPLAYWVAPSVRALFHRLPRLEGSGAEIRQGLATADDFRFVRTFWEVDPRRIGRSREETSDGKRWVPFAKGGEYSPFWADVHLVVDWGEDGKAIREHIDRRYPYLKGNVDWVVKHSNYYFRDGLTWPRRTASGFSVRILPKGSIFADKGPAAFPTGDPGALGCPDIATMREPGRHDDRGVAEKTSSGSPSKSYEAGLVQRLPWLASELDGAEGDGIAEATIRVAGARARGRGRRDNPPLCVSLCLAIRRDDAPHTFTPLCTNLLIVQAIEWTLTIERSIHESLQLDAEAERYLDEEYGPHPASYRDTIEDEDEFARIAAMPVDQVIDEAIAQRGGSRVIATIVLPEPQDRDPQSPDATRAASDCGGS